MDRILITTALGTYRGAIEEGIRVFKGIPYARPPLGSFRFKEADPAPSFSHVLSCGSFASTAMQNRRQRLPMSEDCLYLNIWTPPSAPQPLPVLIFLHGGSLVRGSGADDPFNGIRLAQAGPAVVVTLNFRLGVLGFMDFSHLDPDFQPNVGLRDVVTALTWIHQHIEHFGGDPEMITLMGQSSGATMALVLAVLPAARKYLARVISLSGSPILVQPREHYQQQAQRFLDYARIDHPQDLRFRSPAEILQKQKGFPNHLKKGAGTFMLVQDPEMIPRLPIAAAKDGTLKNLPLLIGSTREELSFTLIRPLARLLEVDHLVDTGANREDDHLRRRIRQAYRRYGLRHLAVLRSEIVFRMPAVWLAHAWGTHNPVWQYRFDFSSPLQLGLRLYAFHSSDLPYVFGHFDSGLGRLLRLSTSPQVRQLLSSAIQQDILTFAATGCLDWPAVTGTELSARCYDVPLRVQNAVDPDILDLFKETRYYQRSLRPVPEYPF